MDTEAPVPNEAVHDVHKALASGAEASSGNYNTMARFQSDSQTLARNDEAKQLKAPGGFRRHYLHGQADAAGVPRENRPPSWKSAFLENVRSAGVKVHEAPLGMRLDRSGRYVAPAKGTAEIPQTVMAVLKSFVGSGITFLPAAFAEGGWLFSGPVLVSIAMFNAICIYLLLECRARTGLPSFGEIASLAVGAKGRLVVQVSIVISQFAFCIAYMIFISQLADSMNLWRSSAVIFAQLIVLVPLCLIRSVENMEYPNLVADILILFGLGVVLVTSVIMIVTYDSERVGAVHPDIVAFKSRTAGLFVGMSIFTFEGVAMILPIQSSMKEPDLFWSVFSKTFAGIAALFTLFGLLGYVAWGNSVQTVVLLNLPHHSGLSATVKVGYMIALMLSVPLMFLPAARITELWAFGTTDEKTPMFWEKNALRATEVVLFAVVALKCQGCFDHFLSFAGAFCCAPIAFIYPTLFHYLLCARTPQAKVLDLFLMSLGFAAVGIALYGSVLA